MPLELAVAPGGFIKQTIVADDHPSTFWKRDNTIMFNVQLLNAAVFKSLIGINPPPTPVSASTYAAYGYPFFKLYEEPSGIAGDFNVKSVAQLDKEKDNEMQVTIHQQENNLSFSTLALNTVDKKSTFLPIALLEDQVRKANIANDL